METRTSLHKIPKRIKHTSGNTTQSYRDTLIHLKDNTICGLTKNFRNNHHSKQSFLIKKLNNNFDNK